MAITQVGYETKKKKRAVKSPTPVRKAVKSTPLPKPKSTSDLEKLMAFDVARRKTMTGRK